MLNRGVFSESYIDFDQEVIKEIVEMFLEDYKIALKNIEKAILENDFSMLDRAAHKYKGTVSAMFDAELRELLQKMEQMGKKSDTKGAKELLEEITTLSNSLADDLTEMIQ